MSLSDRLQLARTRRLIESGALSGEPALKPEADVAAPAPVDDHSGEGPFAPIRIEVQSTGLHLVPATPTELTDIPESDRTPNCPNCNTQGRVDMVDLVGHTVHLTCQRCGTMWQIRQSVNQSDAR